MFGISFTELLLVAVIILLVVGPEKLPETVRTISLHMARIKRFWLSAKRDVEREMGLDDIRREIHNAEVMEHLEKARKANLKDLLPEDIDGHDLITPEQKRQLDADTQASADVKVSHPPTKPAGEPQAEAPSTDEPPKDDVRRKESDAD